MPTIGAKAKWAEMWCNSQHALFAECLVTFAVLAEGIFSPVPSVPFFGLHNVVYSLAYVCKQSHQPQWSSSLWLWLCPLQVLYNCLLKPPCSICIREIVNNAIKIKECFIHKVVLPFNLMGMNATIMSQYIWFYANCLLHKLKQPTIYSEIVNSAIQQLPMMMPQFVLQITYLRQWKALILPLIQKWLVSVWQKKVQQWLGIKWFRHSSQVYKCKHSYLRCWMQEVSASLSRSPRQSSSSWNWCKIQQSNAYIHPEIWSNLWYSRRPSQCYHEH